MLLGNSISAYNINYNVRTLETNIIAE